MDNKWFRFSIAVTKGNKMFTYPMKRLPPLSLTIVVNDKGGKKERAWELGWLVFFNREIALCKNKIVFC